MAKPNLSSSEQRRTAPTRATASRSNGEQATLGTGQEPDPRGVHRPGKAPGEFTDLGPVSIPADAPRTT